MAEVMEILGWICLIIGSCFALISSIAMLRLPDYYSRVHGASITDTMGAGFILFGLACKAGFSLVTVKLGLVLAFLVLTGPASGHALAKAAYQLGLEPVLSEPRRKDTEEDSSSTPA